MPRSARSIPVGMLLHVTNRGNDKRRVFREPVDYAAFLGFLADAGERFAVDLAAYCLMPTHFHLLLRQNEQGAVSAYMHRISCFSACRFRRMTDSLGQGHVFQRRYWSHQIGDESYYLAVVRYVEANPLRAGLVQRAEHWQWGSLWERATGGRELLAPPPLVFPRGWVDIVNGAQPASELTIFRCPVRRGRPGATQPGVFHK